MNNKIMFGIPDHQFIRGDVPMTKQEIRVISIAKLMLHNNHSVADIGAGTGSLSIEIARLVNKGKVFAVEKQDNAIQLIKKNCQKFSCKNVEIIGSVMFVQKSNVSIFGIVDNASSSNDARCDTASDITFGLCVVSASVNSSNSPVAFLYPSIHAQFLPIQPSGFSLAETWMTLEFFFAYSEIIFPVESSDESSITIIS